MNPLSRNVPQRGNHHPLALQPRLPRKGGAFDFHGKVALASAIVAHVAMMTGAVIDHRQPARGEGSG